MVLDNARTYIVLLEIPRPLGHCPVKLWAGAAWPLGSLQLWQLGLSMLRRNAGINASRPGRIDVCYKILRRPCVPSTCVPGLYVQYNAAGLDPPAYILSRWGLASCRLLIARERNHSCLLRELELELVFAANQSSPPVLSYRDL